MFEKGTGWSLLLAVTLQKLAFSWNLLKAKPAEYLTSKVKDITLFDGQLPVWKLPAAATLRNRVDLSKCTQPCGTGHMSGFTLQ